MEISKKKSSLLKTRNFDFEYLKTRKFRVPKKLPEIRVSGNYSNLLLENRVMKYSEMNSCSLENTALTWTHTHTQVCMHTTNIFGACIQPMSARLNNVKAGRYWLYACTQSDECIHLCPYHQGVFSKLWQFISLIFLLPTFQTVSLTSSTLSLLHIPL